MEEKKSFVEKINVVQLRILFYLMLVLCVELIIFKVCDISEINIFGIVASVISSILLLAILIIKKKETNK